MTKTDIITGESVPLTTDEIAEQRFVRRLRWGLVGMYLVVLIGALTIFGAGYFAGAMGWLS